MPQVAGNESGVHIGENMSRERIYHGQKRGGVNAIGTLSATGTQSVNIDLKKGNLHTLTTKTGATSAVSLNLVNAYVGAEVKVLLTSAVASDTLGTVEINGTDVTTDLVVGTFNDEASNLIKITVVSLSSVIVEIQTVA